jgi:hypothetical protein
MRDSSRVNVLIKRSRDAKEMLDAVILLTDMISSFAARSRVSRFV